MELSVSTSEAGVVDGVETVEVIAGGEDGVALGSTSAAATLIDQHMAVANPQEILVPATTEIEGQALDQALMSHSTPIITIPVGPPSPGAQQMLVGTKRSQSEALAATEQLMAAAGTGTLQLDGNPVGTSSSLTQTASDIPRKKSRNYLDSHKTIEKKRRDRINNCLEQLKSLVPDCRQYGSKKLDKAEILEMSIEYIQRMHSAGLPGRAATGLDMNMSQREWANDLTTWVIQNKILHTGANALDGFCQSLLLHLQGMGSGNALASATSMLLNQANTTTNSSEEDVLFRQQQTNTQVALLQQIQQQQQQGGGGVGVEPANDNKDAVAAVGVANSGGGGATAAVGSQAQSQQQLQQAQLTQLQALLLLQQQQQLLSQQQPQETDTQSQQTHLQQLQQLQQLQTLLLQHIANEASVSTSGATTGSSSAVGSASSADSGGEGGASQVPKSRSDGTQTTRNDTTALQVEHTTSVLTSDANPLTSEGVASATLVTDHPAVELTQASEEELGEATEETVYTSAISKMWSSAGGTQANQSSSLLMLGGGSESEGEGVGGINGRPGEKSSLIETSEVHEEVELLSQQEH